MTAPSPARFSLRLNNDLPVADFAELAAAADDAGFDQVWVSHDLFWRSAPVLVAAAVAVTKRVKLGIGIMNPFSAHPSELAMHAATLQELSDGRFLLGLGAGAEDFLAWAGLKRPRPLAASREVVLACRSLLERGRPSDTGSLAGWQPEAHLRFDGPPVPVYLGAMGPKMLALGGEIADGVLGLSFPPERAATSAAIVREAAVAAGRDPADVDVPACFWVSIDDDPERAAAPLAEKLAYYGPSISAQQLADAGLTPDDFRPAAEALERGDTAKARELITPRMLRLGIAGDAKTIIDRCQALIASGATHLSFGPPLGPDPVQSVTRLGSEVLTALSAGSLRREASRRQPG
jgi:5,10-methylenetetrahydromethanopterin reductase